MENRVEREAKRRDARDVKPAYQRPVLTELDAGETATGLIPGTPENSTYYIS